jgi:hypothetical protein
VENSFKKKSFTRFALQSECQPMRALKFVTGHVIYNVNRKVVFDTNLISLENAKSHLFSLSNGVVYICPNKGQLICQNLGRERKIPHLTHLFHLQLHRLWLCI